MCCSAEKVNELQELLNKKDQEMKVMEDRYKKYLEKAKSVSLCVAFVSLHYRILFCVQFSGLFFVYLVVVVGFCSGVGVLA